MMQTILMASGQEITMRRPTEGEVGAYLDKRAIVEAGERPSADCTDDGDHELCACVSSPSRAELEQMLEEAPLLNRHLRDLFYDLAGAGRPFAREDARIPESHRSANKRLLGFVCGDTVLVLQRLSRYDVKALEHEARAASRKGPMPSTLAKLARERIVTTSEAEAEAVRALLAEVPLLAPNLGQQLLIAASTKLQDHAGKS